MHTIKLFEDFRRSVMMYEYDSPIAPMLKDVILASNNKKYQVIQRELSTININIIIVIVRELNVNFDL